MGLLVEGIWHRDEKGITLRQETQIRNWITADGSPGPTGDGNFPAEAGRYHLYLSLACPFSHRALVMRALKSLEDSVSISVTHPVKREDGWHFAPHPKMTPDPIFQADTLYQVFATAYPGYSGRCAVPLLLDKKTSRIVSGNSGEILRMFASAFAGTSSAESYRPPELADEVDALNRAIGEKVNAGVYRVGFARDQESYESAVADLFAYLEELESRLEGKTYLLGERQTESDWFLFPTLLRFDAVYHGLFKCNLKRIADFPNLSRLLRTLYAQPGVAGTVDMDYIKEHYYRSLINAAQGPLELNPTGIIPAGPRLEFLE